MSTSFSYRGSPMSEIEFKATVEGWSREINPGDRKMFAAAGMSSAMVQLAQWELRRRHPEADVHVFQMGGFFVGTQDVGTGGANFRPEISILDLEAQDVVFEGQFEVSEGLREWFESLPPL